MILEQIGVEFVGVVNQVGKQIESSWLRGHPSMSETLEDEVERHLPQSRRDIVLDSELREGRRNERVEDSNEKQVV